jgi:hypothetical protein
MKSRLNFKGFFSRRITKRNKKLVITRYTLFLFQINLTQRVVETDIAQRHSE